MDWVYDGLYIGSIEMICRQRKVRDEGITAIVRLDTGSIGDYQWSTDWFRVLHKPFIDGDHIPDGIIPQVTRFIDKQIANDGVVLVHCAMGISRSATVTMAYLIEYEGMSLGEAFGTVREGRPQAYPHPKLLASLIEHYNLPYNSLDALSPNFIGRLMQEV